MARRTDTQRERGTQTTASAHTPPRSQRMHMHHTAHTPGTLGLDGLRWRSRDKKNSTTTPTHNKSTERERENEKRMFPSFLRARLNGQFSRHCTQECRRESSQETSLSQKAHGARRAR